MEFPTINLTKVVVSVTGAALAAFHTSRRVSDRVWMFAAGNVSSYCANSLIDHYLAPHWHVLAYLIVALAGAFLVREFVAYSDAQSASLLKLLMRWRAGNKEES